MAFSRIDNFPSNPPAPTIFPPTTSKGTKISYDSTGKVLSSTTLTVTDIPSLPISKIIDLQSTLDSLVTTPELPSGNYQDILYHNGTNWIAADTTTITDALSLGTAAFYNVGDLPYPVPPTPVETDPIFTASDAFAIAAADISNWDTAFSWGDHASAGYMVDPTGTDKQTLYYSGTTPTASSVLRNDGTQIGINTDPVSGYDLALNDVVLTNGARIIANGTGGTTPGIIFDTTAAVWGNSQAIYSWRENGTEYMFLDGLGNLRFTNGNILCTSSKPESTAPAFIGHGMRRNNPAAGFNFAFGESITTDPGFDIFPVSGTFTTSGTLLRVTKDSGHSSIALLLDGEGDLGVNTTPNASAVLEASSTTKGFLPPRMTTTQRDAISSPAEGLMIYNTTTQTVDVFTSSWLSLTPA